MKKTILIVVNKCNFLGGIERSLITLLNSIPKNKYKVSLISMDNSIPTFKIPKNVKIINSPFRFNTDANEGVRPIIRTGFKKKKLFFIIVTFWGYLCSRFFGNNSILKKVLFNECNLSFDFLFNFQGTFLITSIFCEDICVSKKKYIRIHFDHFNFINKYKVISQIKNIINKHKVKNILKYDQIFCVSEEITNKLYKIYKTNKIKKLYNIVDKEKILSLSNKPGFNDLFSGIRILSVGRLVYEKGFDIACNICKQLVNKGYNIKRYIIGDGREHSNLKNLIKKNKLENYFTLLGSINNPYPYFKGCDIYVQPSRSEGFCLALAEAKIFHKPIIATKFPGAKEQIINKQTGLLVNMNEKEIENSIEFLILNKNFRDYLSNNLKNNKYDKTMNSDFSNIEQYIA